MLKSYKKCFCLFTMGVYFKASTNIKLFVHHLLSNCIILWGLHVSKYLQQIFKPSLFQHLPLLYYHLSIVSNVSCIPFYTGCVQLSISELEELSNIVYVPASIHLRSQPPNVLAASTGSLHISQSKTVQLTVYTQIKAYLTEWFRCSHLGLMNICFSPFLQCFMWLSSG